MKLMSGKEFARSPDRVLRELGHLGGLVITQDGQPKGILLPTSEETVLEDAQAQVLARARRAVSGIRRAAAQQGLDLLTPTDIDREIAAARKARRLRRSR
jgi:hypothetical protein